jgi:hypothetical protein
MFKFRNEKQCEIVGSFPPWKTSCLYCIIATDSLIKPTLFILDSKQTLVCLIDPVLLQEGLGT